MFLSSARLRQRPETSVGVVLASKSMSLPSTIDRGSLLVHNLIASAECWLVRLDRRNRRSLCGFSARRADSISWLWPLKVGWRRFEKTDGLRWWFCLGPVFFPLPYFFLVNSCALQSFVSPYCPSLVPLFELLWYFLALLVWRLGAVNRGRASDFGFGLRRVVCSGLVPW